MGNIAIGCNCRTPQITASAPNKDKCLSNVLLQSGPEEGKINILTEIFFWKTDGKRLLFGEICCLLNCLLSDDSSRNI